MPLHKVHHLQANYSSNGSPVHLMEDTVTISSTVSVFTRAETRFHLSAKRTIPFKSAGASVQSRPAAELCASAVVMLDIPRSEVM